MVINRYGDVAGGTSTISVNGVTPPPLVGVTAGNPRWFTDEQLIFQAFLPQPSQPTPTWGLWIWRRFAPSAPLVFVDGQGQNKLFAGGAVWAAGLNTGYRDSHGYTNPDWFPLAVDDLTGIVAVVLNRHAGTGLGLWNGTGQPTQIEAGSFNPETMAFKNGLLYYQVGQTFKGYNVSGPVTQPSQVPVQGCYMAPGVRLGYQQGRDMVVFGWTATNGVELHSAGQPLEQDFNPDLCVLPDGTVKVVSSKTQGEAPADTQIYLCHLGEHPTVNGQPRSWVSLFPVTPQPEPPDPSPEPEPEPPMSLVSEEKFKQHAKTTARLLMTPQNSFPANMTVADVENATSVWGERVRAQQVNATHEGMLGAYGATRSERQDHDWPEPRINGSQAEYWNDLVARAIAADISEGLQRGRAR